jgi:Uma2 family endonuclease
MTAPAFRGHPRLWTADQFLDFYASRPQGERWQLVDGLAMMMVPPNLVHQRISGNLERPLNDAVEAHRPNLYAYRETEIRIPGVSDFNPEPDVVVLAAEADYRHYADVFFLVAEVLSPSNTTEMIERKLELYKSHPDNLCCLVIDQDAIRVELHVRETSCRKTALTDANDELRLDAFGLTARVGDLYRGTPLLRRG